MIALDIRSAAAAGTISTRKRLARGTSVYGITSFGLRGLGFVLLAVCSRYLSPGDYGIVSLVESVSTVVGIVSGLGLETGSRRLYFHFDFGDGTEALNSYLGTVLRLAATAAVVTLGTCFLFGPFITSRIVPAWGVNFFPYFALPLVSATASQLIQCRLVIYQCQERLFTYTVFVILQSLSTTLLTLGLVVWKHHGAVGLLTARALGAGITLLATACLSGPFLRAPARWTYARETLRISLPLVPHAATAIALVGIDRFILKRYRTLSEVGLYSLGYSIGMIMTLVPSAISRAWAPLFYSILRNEKEGHRVAGSIFTDLALLLAVIAGVGSVLAPHCIRWFLDPRYWPAARLAPIVIGAYFCHSLFSLFQLSVIQARRTPLVSVVSGVALLSNIALNLAWVPQHGMIGAAYATLAAYAVELALIAMVAHRVLPLALGWLRLSVLLVALAAVLMWTQLRPSNIF